MFILAEGGQTLHPYAPTVVEWPWTWLRVSSYVRQIVNIHERAAMDQHKETAMPPKSIWFIPGAVDEWFESRREQRRTDSRRGL